ncbi:NAD-dependent epimerase [Suicoccus acidiformans]|uniref:NAD-dependent epimerase n=1 Tax=Suicoccus acidiformans TaxID=2036206 RepID=A0A347WJN4_9LACT|nr:NAD-dependent epimerase/dehydratase family protein [Suicoccus acidiformans]AXY25291.1 NAD-dependent epimerase [Suicoccus acidiformans]
MKNILITGLNSYIGNKTETWLNQWPNQYQIDKLSFHGDDWRQKDFAQYDVILNVAGIAHNSNDANLEDLYYQVNRDLAVAIAIKAKEDGVPLFIHLSSIIVYGSRVEEITRETPFDPDNFYGDSKVQAEKRLAKLEDDAFTIAIIRPPMIYGKDSKGNYPLLANFARKSPVFPKYDNKRSMLHIDNLTELIRLIIDSNQGGIYYPQMEDYVSSKAIVEGISKHYHKPILMTKVFNPALRRLTGVNIINKVFGNLYYKQSLSQHFGGKYRVRSIEESIRLSEPDQSQMINRNAEKS